MRYLHNDLEYSSDLQYYTGGHARRWDYTGLTGAGNLGAGYPSTSDMLRTAMAKDPYLHVMVGAGYYDMLAVTSPPGSRIFATTAPSSPRG